MGNGKQDTTISILLHRILVPCFASQCSVASSPFLFHSIDVGKFRILGGGGGGGGGGQGLEFGGGVTKFPAGT